MSLRAGWSARSTTSPLRPGSRCCSAAGARPTRRSRRLRSWPSPPSTCAGWAATCSPSSASRVRRRSRSTPAGGRARAPMLTGCAPRALASCPSSTTSGRCRCRGASTAGWPCTRGSGGSTWPTCWRPPSPTPQGVFPPRPPSCAPSSASATGPSRRSTAAPCDRVSWCADRGSRARCRRSCATVATASTAGSSATGCSPSGRVSTPRTTWAARSPTGSRRCRSTPSGTGSGRSRPTARAT